MVKAYSQEHIYKHPWERVTSASWRKFADPENKRTLSHILEVDTLNRKLDPLSGKLYTTRALTIHAPGPWFIRKIIGQDLCHCVESTVVDAQSKSMQLKTRNVNLQKFIEEQEKIRKVEQRCAEKFMQNSVKGREVMERICKYLEAESSGMAL
ncbi:hypothetical protein REPUB_Repub11eG0092900 [Reevesia pubescens]